MSQLSWARRALAVLTTAALAGTGLVAVASSAAADTVPQPGVPTTVTADPLPTVQIDGVVWHLDVAGNKVFAGGEFTRARPAGANPGQNQVVRNNLLAFDLTTGVLDSSWAPNPNGVVRAVAVSPDGSRVYVGGNFTTIAGQSRLRIAAFDTATGNLVSSFNARTNAQVRAIVATNDTVYVGGIFSTANGETRNKLAAFRASDGALLPWNPDVTDNRVNALEVSPDGSVVLAGGGFTTVGGTTANSRGMVRLDAVTGAKLSFPANSQVWNSGNNGAILQIRGDADNAYLVGYTFGRDGGNLEGVLAVDWATGGLTWLLDCHGDTYDVAAMGDVVYSASHHHYCGNVRAIPQTPSWEFYRGNAMTKAVTQVNQREHLGYYNHEGRPAPSVLTWYPQIDAGTYTGQNQGGWTVQTTDQYLVMGGEFPRVNNTGQQGLVRFAVPGVAPNSTGPRFSGSQWSEASARSLAQGTVRVSWLANFDYDNEYLTYRVIRNGNVANPVYVGTHASTPWSRPWMGFTDTGLTPGSTHTYQVRVTDPFGNQANTATMTVTVDGTGTLSPYAQRVVADGASHYWRFDDTSGAMRDHAGINDAAAGTAIVRNEPGAIAGDPSPAIRVSNNTQARLAATQRQQAVYDYTVETWFRAPTNSQGGHLVGFGSSATPTSNSGTNNRDRALYMDNTGRIQFVLNVGQMRAVRSTAAYRDNQWHHAAATVSIDGIKLYVDGQLVAERSDTTSGRNLSGFWRIGDAISGWPNVASVNAFNGWIDEVAIYPTPLTAEQIAAHHLLGTTGTVPNFPPTAVIQTQTEHLTVTVDGTGSTDSDGTITGYAWNFGDGNTATGATATHTYASAGNYTVTLTVTDNNGATGSTTTQVTATDPPPNQEPVAVIAASTTDLTVTVDGSGSSDPDGTITGYAWTFGDGATATGPTASHTYAAAGDYTVTLTVTDDEGATGTTTTQVTATDPPPNQAPTAVIAASTTDLTVTVSGAGSSDPDGTVTGYAWDFGDGNTATGPTATHTYAAAGSYTITLVVTDDEGATGTTTTQVTATDPPDDLVRDPFSRTVTNAWGPAPIGGTWVNQSTVTRYQVADGQGRHVLTGGATAVSLLPTVSNTDTELQVSAGIDQLPGGNTFLTAFSRRVGEQSYGARVRIGTSGDVALHAVRGQGTTLTPLAGLTIPGLTYTPGDQLQIRVQTEGTNPTTIRAKVWILGTPEPVAWTATTTDNTPALQTSGGVGLMSYLGGSAARTVSWDNLWATGLG